MSISVQMNKSVFNILRAASINIWTGVPHLWPALSNRMWKAEWKLGSNTRAEDPGGLSVFVFVLWDIAHARKKKHRVKILSEQKDPVVLGMFGDQHMGPSQPAQSTVTVLSSWNLDLLFQAAKGHLGQDRAYLTQGTPGSGSLSIFILNYGKWPENTVFKDDVLSSASTGKIRQPNSAGLLGNSLFTGENLWPPLGLAFTSYSLSWTSTKWSTLMGEKGD